MCFSFTFPKFSIKFFFDVLIPTQSCNHLSCADLGFGTGQHLFSADTVISSDNAGREAAHCKEHIGNSRGREKQVFSQNYIFFNHLDSFICEVRAGLTNATVTAHWVANEKNKMKLREAESVLKLSNTYCVDLNEIKLSLIKRKLARKKLTHFLLWKSPKRPYCLCLLLNAARRESTALSQLSWLNRGERFRLCINK